MPYYASTSMLCYETKPFVQPSPATKYSELFLDWQGGRSGKRGVRVALLAKALGADVVVILAVIILVVFILVVVSFVTGSHVVIVSFILVVPLFLPGFAPAIMFAFTIFPIIPLDVTFFFDNLSDVNGLSGATG